MNNNLYYNYRSEAGGEEMREPKQEELQQVEKGSSNFERGDS
jgi:hypothetical protein